MSLNKPNRPSNALLELTGSTNDAKPKILPELVYEQVQKYPDAIAISHGSNNVSYRIMWNRSVAVAEMLKQYSLGKGEVIGVCVRETARLPEILIGILIEELIYTPIDPTYPDERVEHIIEDCNPSAILVDDEALFHRLQKLTPDVQLLKYVDILNTKDPLMNSGPTFGETSDPCSYIIYTSGSTGRPKGVLVKNSSVINTLLRRREAYQLDVHDVCLQLFSFLFDGFVTSAFTPLISGATLVFVNEEVRKDIPKLIDLIEKKKCNHFISVPLLFNQLLKVVNETSLQNLQTVVLVGEQASKEVFDLIESKGLSLKLFNEYGVTEGAVLSTINSCFQKGYIEDIGTPIANTGVVVVNDSLMTQPNGQFGEILLTGVGIAEGYLNLPEETHARFVLFQGERAYRTGDVARYNKWDTLEFRGRMDHQVNLNGFRVELAEVEFALRKHPLVEDSVVSIIEDKRGKRLGAYLVLQEPVTNLNEVIRKHLSQMLPSYMIPSRYIPLDTLPINQNGKVNRKVLSDFDVGPQMVEKVVHTSVKFSKLGEFWKSLLDVETVAKTDDFFEAGGNSLMAISLTAYINEEFTIELELTDVFENPVFQNLANLILSKMGTDRSLVPAEQKEYYTPSSSQKDIYLAQSLNPNSTSYNMSFAAKLIGKIDEVRLQQGVNTLVEDYVGLRSSFHFFNKDIIMLIEEDISVRIERIASKLADVPQHIAQYSNPFNLENSPLMRVLLIDIIDATISESVFFIEFHHIICDGYSVDKFFKDLAARYNHQELNKTYFRLQDYTEWESHFIRSGALEAHRNFWHHYLSDVLNPLSFRQVSDLEILDDKAGFARFSLGEALSQKLVEIARSEGNTLFNIVFAFFTLALTELSGQRQYIVGTPFSSRSKVGDVFGLLVNMLPIKVDHRQLTTYWQLIKSFEEDLHTAFRYHEYTLNRLSKDLKGMGLVDLNDQLIRIVFSFDDINPRFQKKLANIGSISVEPYPVESTGVPPYELYLIVILEGDEIFFAFEYSKLVFNKESLAAIVELVKEHIQHFCNHTVEVPLFRES